MGEEISTVNAMPIMAAQTATSLYVGDLDSSVTEEELCRLFQEKGNVTSVKICVDQTTKQSLGYGYVEYNNPRDATKAVEDLNFTALNGKSIRLSYSDSDARMLGSKGGNIFVKNLDTLVDHKALYDMFSTMGNIISSKVETASSGQSKGYGFVQFDSEEAARKAIEQLNGVILHGKALHVAHFISREERERAIDRNKFTNVFVKNLSEQTTEEDLKRIFGEFGLTDSVALMRHEDGKSKCFGFVNFENYEDALKSVEALNRQIFDGKEWYVARARTKYERKQESRLLNLYIKNLDDNIDDDKLKDMFSSFGNITSSKVMCDQNGISKGSGFVAFSTSQEASRAILAMNGKLVGRKPLCVAILERKEDRQARMKALFSIKPLPATPPAVAPHVPMHLPTNLGLGQQMLNRQAPPTIRPPMPEFGHYQQLFPGMRPRFGHHQQYVLNMWPSRTHVPNMWVPFAPHGIQNYHPNGFVQQGQCPVPMMYQQMPYMGNGYHFPPGFGLPNGSQIGSNGGVYRRKKMQRTSPPLNQISGSAPASDNGRLLMENGGMPQPMFVGGLASRLANASPADQRVILNKKLYPLVKETEREMAAKVTEMLLQMDQAEVLHLLESPQSLRAKVAEAVEILKSTPDEQLASLSLAD